jgi:hypothetical protein
MGIQERLKARIQKQQNFASLVHLGSKEGASWSRGRFSIFDASKFSSGFIINLSDLLHLSSNFSSLDELYGLGKHIGVGHKVKVHYEFRVLGGIEVLKNGTRHDTQS